MVKYDGLIYKLDLLSERVRTYKMDNFKNVSAFKLNKSTGLSFRQLEILSSLEYLEVYTVSELAVMMNLSKSTLSILMGKLIKKGYVYKELPKINDDGRKIYFKLTDEGRNLVYINCREHLELFRENYNLFNTEQKENLKKGVKNLRLISQEKNFNYEKIVGKIILSESQDQEWTKVAEDLTYFAFGLMSAKRPFFSLEEELSKHITPNQCMLLYCVGNLNINTVSKLEKHTNSSGSTISITISKMVEKGFLYKEKASDNEDGRKVYIKTTQYGYDILKKYENSNRERILGYIKNLDDYKQGIFAEGLDYLLKVFI